MNKKEALEILGLTKENPNEKEINKAFKKKAAKLHPDVNKAKDAEQKFKELGNAKSFLLDPKPKRQYTANNRTNADDIFNRSVDDFFKQQNPFGARVVFRSSPITKYMNVSFIDSVLGTKKKIIVEKTVRCTDCICKTCNGIGSITKQKINGNVIFSQTMACPDCKGYCRSKKDCKTCKNTGIVDKKSEFSVNIPGGVQTGNTMRLRGFGNVENHNGRFSYGDIHLKINVEPDKDMELRGNNVISSIDVSLLEALKGANKNVRTVLGDTNLNIKPGIKNKDVVTLKNHGVNRQGAHLFLINVQYPKNTDKLIKVLEEI